jgi:hypothetical protein
MRQHKPLHLSDLDVRRTADDLTWSVHARAWRDARRLGMSYGMPPDVDQKNTKLPMLLARSSVHKAALTCAAWATAGKGTPEEVAVALRELRADLEGLELGEAPGREPDLSTAAGLVVVAAAARLALVEGRALQAVEVATLASLDERSIRAAAAVGTLPSVGPGRPMRFAASVVCEYLYGRGVPGFGVPATPPPAVSKPAGS